MWTTRISCPEINVFIILASINQNYDGNVGSIPVWIRPNFNNTVVARDIGEEHSKVNSRVDDRISVFSPWIIDVSAKVNGKLY